jgi:hypothetical protein
MVMANTKGRQTVEGLWPDVEWTTDEGFSSYHSPDWKFAHVKVTRLPDHLAEVLPLEFASPDSLGVAVTIALQCVSDARRVLHFTSYGHDPKINFYDVKPDAKVAAELFVEFVPAGTVIGAPQGVH